MQRWQQARGWTRQRPTMTIVHEDLTPHEASIDWSGARPTPVLDEATEATWQPFLQAIDKYLDTIDVPSRHVTTMQPNHLTTQVIEAGLVVAEVTDDLLAAETLFRLCEHVVALREDVQTAQQLQSAALAHLNQQHRKTVADREARHAR